MRRIVGVDPAPIQLQPTTPEGMAKPDLGATEQQWQQTAANSLGVYQERFRGLGAQQQALQAEAQRAANRPTGGVADVMQGVQTAVETYSQLKGMRMQEDEAERQQALAERKLFEEQREQEQRLNASDVLANVQGQLTIARDKLYERTDAEGFFSTYSEIQRWIMEQDLSPEDRDRIQQFAYDALSSVRQGQLSRARELGDKARTSAVDVQIAQFDVQNAEDRGIILGNPLGATDAISRISGRVDEALALARQQGFEGEDFNRFAATLLSGFSDIAEGSAEARAMLAGKAQRLAEANQAVDGINAQFDAGELSLEEASAAIQQWRLYATGEASVTSVTQLDRERQLLERGRVQQQLTDMNTPDAAPVADLNLAMMWFQMREGQLPMTVLDEPGMEAVKTQFMQFDAEATRRLREQGTLSQQLTATDATIAQHNANITRLQQIYAGGTLAINQAQEQGLIRGGIPGLEAAIQESQVAVQQATAQRQQLAAQYGSNQQFLQRYNIIGNSESEGIANFGRWAASPQGQQAISQLATVQAAAEQNRGAASNFPSNSRRPPVASLQTVGGDNRFGAPGRSPFLSSDLQPSDVHITAHIKAGSHADGNALDFAAPGGTSVRIGAMTSGVVVDVNNDGHGGGYGNFVVIRDAQGRHWLYAHNHRNTVRTGDTVSQGQHIGFQGNTGASNGDHVHVEVWDGLPGMLGTGGTGRALPVEEWYPSVRPEQDVRTVNSGVSSMGLPPTPGMRRGLGNTAATQQQMPAEAIAMPGGMYYMNGRFYMSDGQTPDSRHYGTNPATPTIGIEANRLTSYSRPLQGNLASPDNTRYTTNRANPAANYGYQFLANHAPVRAKIAQIASRLNIPGQWIADTMAMATRGTFNHTQQRNGRYGAFMFTEGFLRSVGVSTLEVNQMPMERQLDLFYRMLAGSGDQYAGRYDRIERVVMATLSGGDKDIAMGSPRQWDSVGRGQFGVWDVLRQLGQGTGRAYATYADVYDPQDNIIDRVRPTSQLSQNMSAAGGVSPRWTGNGLSVAAQELDPRMKAFLDLIARVEGGWHEDSYRQIVGGGLLPSLSGHPDTGRSDNASGRYQFIGTTWAGYADGGDFSPANQDRAAARLIQSHGIWRRIEAGDVEGAIFAAAPTWRGLPQGRDNLTYQDQYAGYNRAGITWQDALKFFQERLQYYTGGVPPMRTR